MRYSPVFFLRAGRRVTVWIRAFGMLVLLLLGLASAARADDPLRVLFIGNSYTYFNDLPRQVADLAAAYSLIAAELDVLLAPVGVAWQNAFAADPSLVLHISDMSHPNPLGSYLAACVFFATFYGRSPVGLPNNYGLSDEEALFLQLIAWQTVSPESPQAARGLLLRD